jgi:hypothetical protein
MSDSTAPEVDPFKVKLPRRVVVAVPAAEGGGWKTYLEGDTQEGMTYPVILAEEVTFHFVDRDGGFIAYAHSVQGWTTGAPPPPPELQFLALQSSGPAHNSGAARTGRAIPMCVFHRDQKVLVFKSLPLPLPT